MKEIIIGIKIKASENGSNQTEMAVPFILLISTVCITIIKNIIKIASFTVLNNRVDRV